MRPLKILAIDPGIRNFGWALYDQGWECGEIKTTSLDAPTFKEALDLWWKRWKIGANVPAHVDVLICERMQAYAPARAAGQTRDLIDLSIQTGMVIASVSHGELALPTAQTWTGGKPATVRKNIAIRKHGEWIRRVGPHASDAIGMVDWYLVSKG